MKFFFLMSALLIFNSCMSVEIKDQTEPCTEQRLPSSEKLRCIHLVESNSLKSISEKSKRTDGGLVETTLTNFLGAKVKEGPEVIHLDPKQIVSFYSDRNSDGTPNRGGVLVQGTPTEIIFDHQQRPAYVIFAKQRVRLLEFISATEKEFSREIKNQSYARHPEGFSTPVGLLKGWKMPIAEYSVRELKSLFEAMTVDGVTTLEFQSGVIVKGEIENYIENSSGNFGSPTVITFKSGTCSVTYGDRVLFSPKWGTYDMLLAHMITETNGRADNPVFNADLEKKE